MKQPPAIPSVSLAELTVDQTAIVWAVDASRHPHGAALGHRLSELGFFAGERLRIVARGPFGGEPIAVRVGTSTFALRRHEADCVHVHLTEMADPGT